jgi:ribosome-interacting GTPase 1
MGESLSWMCMAGGGRYVYNKVDVCSIEEVDAIARMPASLPCSASQGLNMDGLLERMWDMMALVRAYTKKVGP